MEVIKPFPLGHVALYAKGWYRKTDDIFSDLRKILEFDDYTPYTNSDVVVILLRNYEQSIKIRLIDFVNEIHPLSCWKVGYYPNEGNFRKTDGDYDLYKALIYKILSDVRFLSSDQWIVKTPRYSKDFKRPDNITLKQVIDRFNKK
jgi:hypothetical protein